MKKILIAGKNSYIGTSFSAYMARFGDARITAVSVRGEDWKKADFSGYDCLFHVAGIAHADLKKLSEKEKRRFYEVNTDLALAVARKAKAEGVKQFIFMSSSIVYGSSAPIGQSKMITLATPVQPDSAYGDSKAQAEAGLLALADAGFKVCIVRSPMVYGKFSKGNYAPLSRLAQKTPVFPKIQNARSMLYIGNLTAFIRLLILNEESGIFWPQNAEYTNTGEMVCMIAAAHGKKVWLAPGLGGLLRLLAPFSARVNKVFGSLTYDQSLSAYKQEYRLVSLAQSIQLIERE